MSAEILLEGRSLTKTFGRFTALHAADFAVRAGEVHGLCGSNGAGKSTLIKILTGAHAPTSGTVEICGKSAITGDPLAMLDAGIACIYQHSNLVATMTVLDNIYLGRAPKNRFGFIDKARQRREAEQLMESYGIFLPLDELVSNLATVKQKELEILKALALNAQVILMDEPTAWLAHTEVTKLQQTIAMLKGRGVGLVYISHVLDEVFEVCDKLTVMRDGKIVWVGPTAETNRPELVDRMVGDSLGAASRAAGAQERFPRGNGEVRLSLQGTGKTNVFDDVSLDVHSGEILCLTGLIGAKRTELLHCVFGSDKFDSGKMVLEGKEVAFSSPKAAIDAGIALVPEDRHIDGLALDHSIAENLPLASLGGISRMGLLDNKSFNAVWNRQMEDLNIVPREPGKKVGRLSGGNQQKVLLGKWLETKPRVLILDEPTVGVDVGAKAEIYAILRQMRDQGTAVLVVSSDMEEVMTIADRVAVMVRGRLTSTHDADNIQQDELLARVSGEWEERHAN
ncbi:sugar ABC transporter ATP-binding protein [Polycladidibacter hongkongensis]|uniref:sugar ABC transporter ATP-binding protein n=1 Tax=Polycladidibacter hongkongensis TaxID=1647556 RepID=UPI00082F6662|nr:sugar ABC transporter ATP-binding protein [Pseudovibrio hongkongensis]